MTVQPLPVPVRSGEPKPDSSVQGRSSSVNLTGRLVGFVVACLLVCLAGQHWVVVQRAATRVGAGAASGLHLATRNPLATVFLVQVVLIVVGVGISASENRRHAEQPRYDVR